MPGGDSPRVPLGVGVKERRPEGRVRPRKRRDLGRPVTQAGAGPGVIDAKAQCGRRLNRPGGRPKPL